MKIEVPFEKLRHICHIADVHIRLFRRHDEYLEVFDKLYASIREQQNNGMEDFVIVLAGDIVHAKTDMSPEMIQMTSTFLSTIADIAPTILIAGNHDCNLANSHRMDALSPIVDALGHKNLHYIKHADTVYVADTSFSVMSIFDDKESWPAAEDIDDIYTKIALYHGPVHGATTDTRFTITNRHVHVETFNGFDCVLLGDIHKAQLLQDYRIENGDRYPVIAYCGSLIQQNFGELYEDHGWARWDVPNRSLEIIQVYNDCGYITLEVVNNKIEYPAVMPKKLRLRLFTGELDNTKTRKLISSLRKKYEIVELSVNKSRYQSTLTQSEMDTNASALDVSDITTQSVLIKTWLSKKYPQLDQIVLDKILKIGTEFNRHIKHSDHSRNIHWKPIKFTFSNMFSYGDGNEINFADMNGLYGIFAPNATGKSSIMDALMFCLYDKTPRAFKGNHIMNNRKNSFECELTFEINNETFKIHKVGKRKKSGDVKVDVSFCKETADGELSLNGEDRRDTSAQIRNYVGSYEDFVMTSLSTQTGNSLFIDKSHSERKDLLMQFMGLDIFDSLYNIANDRSKEIAGVLKRFNKSDTVELLSSATEDRNGCQLQLDELSEISVVQAAELARLEDLSGELRTTILPTPDIPHDRETLQGALSKHTREVASLEKKLAELAIEFDVLDKQQQTIIAEVEDMDEDELRSANEKYVNELAKISKLKDDLVLISRGIKHQEAIMKALEQYKYNPSCEICLANNATAVESKATATEELLSLSGREIKLREKIEEMNGRCSDLKTYNERYTRLQLLQSELSKIQQKIKDKHTTRQSIMLTIQQNEIKLIDIDANLKLYETNENNIEHNKRVNDKIEKLTREIGICKNKITQTELSIRDCLGNFRVMEDRINVAKKELHEVEEIEIEYEALNYYMDAIGRDGVPYEIITKTIPNIEREINSILTQVVEFTISLEVDGKNINGKLNYDYDRIWPLENSSGMERFISGLAIRIALTNVSSLPKSSFLIVDEGFGVLDAENLHSMQTLFNILKTHFDFILIVSHLEATRDMVENLIEIRQDDGYSLVNA